MNTDIDSFTRLLALAEKYGLSVVLLIGLIIGIIFLLRWLSKKFDAMFAAMISFKEVVPDPSMESVEGVTYLNKSIRVILQNVQTKYSADYVHLWQFHNGVRMLGKARIPFMYIALTNSVYAPDCIPVQAEFTQLPTSLVMDMLYVLIGNDIYAEKKTENGFVDNPITKRMYELGIIEQYYMPVRDVDGGMIGVFEVCFSKLPELTEGQKTELKTFSQRIAITLATYEDDVTKVKQK